MIVIVAALGCAESGGETAESGGGWQTEAIQCADGAATWNQQGGTIAVIARLVGTESGEIVARDLDSSGRFGDVVFDCGYAEDATVYVTWLRE